MYTFEHLLIKIKERDPLDIVLPLAGPSTHSRARATIEENDCSPEDHHKISKKGELVLISFLHRKYGQSDEEEW